VSKTIHCHSHGENQQAFVCIHLTGESSGLGFNRDEPSEGNEYPDAWCDNCELIQAAHTGWDGVPEGLCEIVVICSECYERSRIRNTRPSVTLADLDGLRWKCSTCEEWHTGPMLDLSFHQPVYWSEAFPVGSRWELLPSGAISKTSRTFLDEDFCAINDEDFFVRGNIHLPIIGAAETFCWGVWGSLSRENFETLLRMDDDPERVNLPPMFSWLSSEIAEYPSSLSLKMYAHIQGPGLRPHFHLERTDHPLTREYHYGITPERLKEIMFRALPPQSLI
jgi:hypothetical protein